MKMKRTVYLSLKKNAMIQNIILNHIEIEHKVKRIAYQIYETFAEEDEIILNHCIFFQR